MTVAGALARLVAASSLRDDAGLAAAVTGATAVMFLPAALVAVGPSRALLDFALLASAIWCGCALAQVGALRACRSHRWSGGPSSLAVQCLCVSAAGIAAHALVGPIADAASNAIGLIDTDAWSGDVVGGWLSVPLGLFMVWHREGGQRHAAAARRLHAVQRAQLSARRALTESQLQAVQARVDPQHFFDTLDAIERLYRHDAPRAEALFDELVAFLRAALPSLDTGTSTLSRELALARSAVRLHALATGDAVTLAVDAAPPWQQLAFPPGVLLPLLRGALAAGHGARRLAIAVRAVADAAGPRRLQVDIDTDAAPDAATQQGVADALRALFGSAASLTCEAAASGRVNLRVSLADDDI